MRLRPTLRTAAVVALVSAATPALAQFGGLLRNLPVPLPTVPGVTAPAAPAGGNTGDLFQLLQQSVETIDEPKEIEIGRQLAAVLLGSKALHQDMALQRYVNQLGRWISLHSSRPHLPWTFGVIDDPGFNAFAAPGGYVFMTKGLVDRVDEAELAGILAHEITHVVDRHHLKALNAKARAGLGAQLIGSQLRGDLRGMVSQQALSLIRNIYTSGLDQGDEYDADRHGVALAARAGFDPYGLPAVLQQLRTVPKDNPLFSLTFSTHPPAAQRLDTLEQAMGNRLDAFAGKPSVGIPDRLR